jgi:hypothetical protein
MSTERTYDRVVAYLKGLLSYRQRHELEKDMMRDVFEEEAFEGLSQLSGDELEADMAKLGSRLEKRVAPAKKRDLKVYFRLAAAIILVAGLGGIVYFTWHTPSANLLTVEQQQKKTATEPAPVAVKPDMPANESAAGENRVVESVKNKKSDNNRPGTPESAEKVMTLRDEKPSQPAAMVEEKAETMNLSAPRSAAVDSRRSAMKTAVAAETRAGLYSGTVVDRAGEALPGVTITESGTKNGTVTDGQGKFSIALRDTNSSLDFRYIGYKPVELKAGKMPADKITLEEDLVALNEVVVVGYATRKKDDLTGAVTTIEYDKDLKNSPPELTKPVPPGGSLKSFKKWVNDRLDYSAFKAYPGKQRISVELTVHTDGSVSDILINDKVPEALAQEFKKVILQSPSWNPALRDQMPVEAQVVIRFIITVE